MLLRPAFPKRFLQELPKPFGSFGKGVHRLAIDAGTLGRSKQLTLTYPMNVVGLCLKSWLIGSQPARRLGMPNASLPAFNTPIGSPPITGVVETPLLALKIPPNSHPPSTAAAGPCRDPAGICHVPL